MKKIIIPILVVLAIAGLAAATCPDKRAHQDAIVKVISEWAMDKLKIEDDKRGDAEVEGVKAVVDRSKNLLVSAVSGVSDFWLSGKLKVKNYVFFSIGKMKLRNEVETVSVGVFGIVFTFSKKDIDEVLPRTIKEELYRAIKKIIPYVILTGDEVRVRMEGEYRLA